MFRTTRTKLIGLSIAGVVALSGGVYATTALAAGETPAYTLPAQAPPTQTASTTGDWRSSVLDMLEDHMGLIGPKAEEFADEMIDHMRGIDEDFDVQEMVDWCTQYAGDGSYRPGMMGDMMDEDDFAYGGAGMMGDMMDWDDATYDGWHMMSRDSAPEAGSPNRGSNAPGAPGPQQSSSGSTPGGMMGDTADGSGSTTGSTPEDWGMMGIGMMGSGMM